jgi:hypothetical protein
MLLVFFTIALVILAVCLFSNTSTLLMIPLNTPAQFLSSMPHITLSVFGRDLILIQPSSTFFIYLLGVIMIIMGIYFLATKKDHQSRYYWAIGLILWGAGAIVAGTSYQAFGYELKCRGQVFCLFTSNFELVYLLLTAYSINFLVAAAGYTSTGQLGRKRLAQFALIDSAAYSVYLFVGAILPVKFLISYEGFMAFIGLNFVLIFILNVRHYIRYKDILNRNLILIWIAFLLVNIGYFAFLFTGFGGRLYQDMGIWFNENDVLHVLLILWAFMIFILLRKHAQDTGSEIHPEHLRTALGSGIQTGASYNKS